MGKVIATRDGIGEVEPLLASAIDASIKSVAAGSAWMEAQQKADRLRREFDLAEEESARRMELWRARKKEIGR